MTDPALLAHTLEALAAQSRSLASLLERLRFTRGSLLPDAPSFEWRGLARATYCARLDDVHTRLDRAIGAVENARAETERALSTLGDRVG